MTQGFPLEKVACRAGKPSQSAPITSPFPLYRKGGFIRGLERRREKSREKKTERDDPIS